MRFIYLTLIALAWLPCLASFAGAGHYEVLYSFSNGSDGGTPDGGLTAIGQTLFGTTAATHSGSVGLGTVFSLNTDGSDFQTLHTFVGTDGANPQAALLHYGAGTTLYGTTAGPRSGQPDDGNRGTIFSMDADGSNFQTLHFFGTFGTRSPAAQLTPVNGLLYGTASRGNEVFSIEPDGSNFGSVQSFTPGQPHLAIYAGGVLQHGGLLYGTTIEGGANNDGIVYSMNVDGTNVQPLHTFSGMQPMGSPTPSDGANPTTDLTIVGTRLYGTTYFGGDDDYGTLFSMNLDGSDYQVMHQFDGTDGSRLTSALVPFEAKLYGLTAANGTLAGGNLFSIGLDGSNFHIEYEFGNGANAPNGASPAGNLLLLGDTFYGVTAFGGAYSRGIVFSYQVPEPGTALLATFGAGLAMVFAAWRRLVDRRKFQPPWPGR